jgi:hypothetical protein
MLTNGLPLPKNHISGAGGNYFIKFQVSFHYRATVGQNKSPFLLG